MTTNSTVRCFYEFGPYRLDPDTRLLSLEGKPLALPPKVIDTLFVLVENAGQALELAFLVAARLKHEKANGAALAKRAAE